MDPLPLAAPSPDGNGTGTGATPLRICVYHVEQPSDSQFARLRERLPGHARLALFGGCTATTAWSDAERVADPDAWHPTAVLKAAAARFRGEHILLVRADLDLPALACERLLRALEVPDVLGAIPLDGIWHRPLPQNEGTDIDAHLIDALCFAYSDRGIGDDPDFDAHKAPWFSAWHGKRLARLDAADVFDRDAIDAAGFRVVLLDHLYVEGGTGIRTLRPSGRDPRDPMPPSPLAPLQQRVAAALAHKISRAPSCPGLDDKPVLLHVLHGWGGGAERWVRDFAAADTSAHHLVLIARGSFKRRRYGEWLELHDGALSGPPLRRWPLPRPIADTAISDKAYRDLFASIVRDYCVDAIVVSSLIGHSLDALRSGLPLYRVVHDHYPLWPTLHRDFGDPSLRFDDAQRSRDLAADAAGGEFTNRDPMHWKRLRDATVAALREARANLIAPSGSALANELRIAPDLAGLPARVIAHGLAPWPADAPPVAAPPTRERLRLVVPGRIRRGKGAELLVAALPRLREHAELFLVGAGADAHDLFGERGVHIVLDYRRDELPNLLARIQPDAALLLPTVAETFSYTLSELRSLCVPVMATRVGALAERIQDGVDGFLVEPDVDALAACIESLAKNRDALARVRSTLAGLSMATSLDMAKEYTAMMNLGPRPRFRYPITVLDGAALDAAVAADLAQRSRERERALDTELDAVRAESERRGDWGHAMTRQFEERSRWASILDSELQEMLASTSWRITAPLRNAKMRTRRLRAGLQFRTARWRSLLGRLRGSVAQRGIAGTVARIARNFGGSTARARKTWRRPRDDFSPFAVPTSDIPRVSIVIPVFEKIAYTSACLRSICEHASAIPFEVIVIDDASNDATPRRLADVGGIRVVRNPENLGFIGSCNAGAAMARGEYLLFLNNDTLVTAGWLDALVRCIETAPDAGMVGAKLVYPDGRLQESGGIVFNDGSGWNVGRFEDADDPRYCFRRETDYCSGAAILMRRDLFNRLGAFDTRYAPAYYEDTDLAFAVRAAGFKVYVEPTATVVHFEGITSGTDTSSGIKRYQTINRAKFREKWKRALAHQPAPGAPITLAATHRAKLRVLIIDANTPTPDQDSGSLRMLNVMRVLADLGCQASFLPDDRLYVERYTPALQDLGVEALYAPYVQDPVKLLRERGPQFHWVILSRHYVAAAYVGLVRLYAPNAKLAFDTVDLHYLREERAAELASSAELARHAAKTRAQELKLIRECDITLVVSSAEQTLLARDAPGQRIEVLSNVHEVFPCRMAFGERRDLVFVGGFQHPPNADAVKWFVGEVFPLIRTSLEDVRVHVVGSRVPQTIRNLESDHVIVHGYVEDIAPFMEGCRVSVAPLRYGAGVKGKVNMAMSYGLPVVATAIAVEGMQVRADEDVLVADDAAAFAAAVLRVYRDEALWNTLSGNGRANVERHFSFPAARAAIQRIFGV